MVFVVAFLTIGCQSVSEKTTATDEVVEKLQSDALLSDMAWDILASLTSEVGPRMAGTEGDKLAVKWAIEKMRDMGFDRVWTEPVKFPRWVRTSESAEVYFTPSKKKPDHELSEWEKMAAKKIRLLKPVGRKLAVTALGGSPSTHGRLEAEVVHFETLEALEAADSESVHNRIVFLSTRMRKTREGTGYGETVVNRSRGPFVAASKGALALLIRSVGTDSDRLAHTGNMSSSETGDRVPSAAVSNPDADILLMMLADEEPVVVRLDLDVGFAEGDDAEATSFNVVGHRCG